MKVEFLTLEFADNMLRVYLRETGQRRWDLPYDVFATSIYGALEGVIGELIERVFIEKTRGHTVEGYIEVPPCGTCRGSKKYVGFLKVEECDACRGRGYPLRPELAQAPP